MSGGYGSGLYGYGLYGALAYSGAPVVTIDGVSVTVPDFPGVGDDIGQRSRMSFTVVDNAGTLALRPGQNVLVTDANGTRVWEGWVSSAVLQALGHTNDSHAYGWRVQATDNVYLADKRIAAASYTNQTAGFIVRDLITSYLSAEGVYSVKNLLTANESNVETNTTGFSANNSATLTQDATQFWQGTHSLKCVTGNLAAFEGWGVSVASTSLVAGQRYTLSVYLQGSGTVEIHAQQQSPLVGLGSSAAITLTNTWARYSLTFTAPNPLVATNYQFLVFTTTQQAATFYADGLQWEPNPTATEWEVGGTDTVQNGPTLTSYVISYEQVSTHLDKLATLATFYWNIDKYRRLTFATYALNAAPWTFDGTQADDPDGSNLMAVQYTDPLYRNGEYVLGITEVTTTQTETRKGDGTTTVFTMSYPLHSAPTVTVNSVAQTVGIKGVDSSKQWYWNKGDATISQDSGGVKLISTDTFQAVYVGEFQTLTYSEDGGAISERVTTEGGTTSGRVQHVTTDPTLVTSSQGFQTGAALLAKYATSGKTLTFLTRTSGLAAGQLLTVNVPAAPWGISNETYLIQSCQTMYLGFEWRWKVTALSGPVNDTWVNFWQRIAGAIGVINTTTAGSSSSLTLLESASVAVALAVSGNATPITFSLPSASLFPAATLFPGTAGTPVAITWTKTNAGLNALRDVLSGTDGSLKGAYLAWGTGTQGTPATATQLAAESGRKALAAFTNGATGAVTLEYVLGPSDAVGTAITEVGVFGGAGATTTANSGILLLYGAYTHTKTNTESINIEPTVTFS